MAAKELVVAEQPLAGTLVLDFSTLLPGPLAGLMLAEAGARVIKIERPEGEDMRFFSPRWGTASADFALLNRGKESLAVDLKSEDGHALVQRLIASADIVIEQFRPGVMDRLRLGYDDCRRINPGLVYCAISGYGALGPKSRTAGHDLNYIGDTGLLSLSMGPADRPVVPPALVADIGGGSMPAVINILLALIRREKTGEGAYLDIAMSDAMFMFAYRAIATGLSGAGWARPGGELLTGGSPRYQIYPTGDGRHVAVAALEQRFWSRFCDLIGLPAGLRDDEGQEEACIAAVRDIISAKSAAHWRETFAGQDCCSSIVASLQEALQEPHFAQRGLFDHLVENDKGDRLPAAVVPVDPQFRGDPKQPKKAPDLGADNEALSSD